MNTIEVFLHVVAGMAIVMAIIFIEMVAISIVEIFNQEQKEEYEEDKDI